jgi:hypothetical protein
MLLSTCMSDFCDIFYLNQARSSLSFIWKPQNRFPLNALMPIRSRTLMMTIDPINKAHTHYINTDAQIDVTSILKCENGH